VAGVEVLQEDHHPLEDRAAQEAGDRPPSKDMVVHLLQAVAVGVVLHLQEEVVVGVVRQVDHRHKVVDGVVLAAHLVAV